MALIEAVLTYRPHGTGSEQPVPIGATSDPGVLRALRNRLLDEMAEEARMWRSVDPGIAALKEGNLARLVRALSVIFPDDDLRPDLAVLVGGRGRPGSPGAEK
jgi:hypothetical protein